MKVNFNLKTPKDKISQIQLKFTLHRLQYRISTGLKINPELWNPDDQRMRGRSKDAEALNLKLRLISDKVYEYLRFLPFHDVKQSDEVKLNVQNIISTALRGYYIGKNVNPDILPFMVKSNSRPNISTAMESYLDKNKLTFSSGRQSHYKSCINLLKELNLGHIWIDRWDVGCFENLRDRLIEKNKKNDTILIKVKMVKAVIRDVDPHHPSLVFKFKSDAKHDQPTLTEGELEQLRLAIIPSDMERTRDLFLFQCFTGQRISDVQTLRKANIHQGIWTMTQRKTNKYVKVPLSADATKILEKYNYSLPKFSDQYHNRNLKNLAQLAQLNRLVHIQRKSGTKIINIEKPIHKFIASHMARRIFITHCLNAGKPLHLIARITGQTISTLQRYEQAGDDALNNFW